MAFWKNIAKNIYSYRVGIFAVFFFYVVAFLGQSLLGWMRYTQAESPHVIQRLIAVLVEDSLLKDLKEDLDWYTKTYMSQRVDNAFPLVIPIHDDYTPHDIQNILENLYADGLTDHASRLEGLVAIGDVPLPVVYDQDVSYESVFPYVDFSDSAYIRSPHTKRFESTKHIQKPTADIRHGLMPWGSNPSFYRAYFAKLRNYHNSPSTFVAKKAWLDDFSSLGSVIDGSKIPYYVQGSVFAEDLNYRRYSNLLFSLLQRTHNDRVSSTLSAFSDTEQLPLDGDDSDEFTSALNTYTQSLSDQLNSNNMPSISPSGVPTLMLQKMIDKMLLSYPELLSKGYRSQREQIIKSIGRRGVDDIDSHDQKIFTLDASVQGTNSAAGIMTRANTLLETSLLKAIKNNNYAVPYPLFDKVTKNIGLSSPLVAEGMYYGKKTASMSTLQDQSIYQGTYKNLTDIDSQVSHSHSRASVGASYGILNTQITANRLYNISLMKSDTDRMNDVLGESNQEERNLFIKNYRGGNTPLNLAGGQGGLVSVNPYDPRQVWTPPAGSIGGGSVFDRAGSKKTSQDHGPSSSFLDLQNIRAQAVNHTGSFSTLSPIPYYSSERHIGWHSTLPLNFFDLWSANAQGSISQRIFVGNHNYSFPGFIPNANGSLSYYYTLVDSTVVHASPNPTQVSAMNFTTPDRPIDSDHFVTFQGLNGDVVKLVMPNIWDVPVFNTIGSGENQSQTLLSVEDITTSIASYLRQKVTEYNTQLTEQNSLSQARYSVYSGAYNLLKQADPLASVDRTYSLLSDNFLVDLLGDAYIKRVARALWWHNLPWKNTVRSEAVLSDIGNATKHAHIDHKISAVVDSYLHEGSDRSLLPTYNASGYESIALHSDTNGTNFLGNDDSRSVADAIEKKKIQKKPGITSTGTDSDDEAIDESTSCNYVSGAPVPLLTTWLDAVSCRWKQTRKKPLSLKLTLPSMQNRGKSTWDNFLTNWQQFGDSFVQQESATNVADMITTEAGDNDKILSELSPSDRILLRQAYDSFDLRWSTSTASIDAIDTVDMIFDRGDFSGVSFGITSTGAQCVFVDGIDTCQSPYVLSRNGSHQEYVSHPSFTSLQAGTVALRGVVCIKNTSTCLTKTKSLVLMPGALNKATVEVPATRVAAGSLLPLSLKALDAGDNVIGRQSFPLAVSSSIGGFVGGNTVSQKQYVYDPLHTLLQYRVPSFSGSNATGGVLVDTITLTHTGNNPVTYDTKNIVAVSATIDASLRYQGEEGASIAVGLSDSMLKNNRSSLVHATVVVRDSQGTPLPYQYMTVSGDKGSMIVDKEGRSRELWQTDENGVLHLGLVPRYVLGESTVYVGFYGADDRVPLRINWKPGSPNSVTLSSPVSVLSPGDSTTARVTVRDKRKNIINDQSLDINLFLHGSATFSGEQTSRIVRPNATVTITSSTPGKVTMAAVVAGSDTSVGDSHEWSVITELLSLNKINGMTLLLDGQGRGDRSSQGSKRPLLSRMFASSQKLLSMATTYTPSQLIGSGSYAQPRGYDAIPGSSLSNTAQKDATPLTDWAQGATWGSANKSYSHPLTVIFGDPLVTHMKDDAPHAHRHNGERGERIFTNPNKVIKQSLMFDFNNDSLKDMLVLYEDNSIELLKNYGGKSDPYVDMGLLLLINGSIKKIFVGDVDGNGFDDIIAQLDNGQLRAYTNKNGIFDVDGYPLCLQLGDDDSGLGYAHLAHQIFFHDMDNDGAVDIVTNDTHGVVTVTYGGSGSYLSRDHLQCDAGWSQRSQNNQTAVARLGLAITDQPVRDGSLVHRKGLTYETPAISSGGISPTNHVSYNPLSSSTSSITDALNQSTSPNIDQVVSHSVGDAYRYMASPTKFVPPYYNNALTYRDMYYVPSYSQRDADPVRVEKFFKDYNGGSLLPGDRVKVTVRAYATENTVMTYFDNGRGSRELEKKNDNTGHKVVGFVLSGFDWSDLSDENIVYKDAPTSSYLYMLDNVPFVQGQTRERSYDLIYRGGPLTQIDVRYFNDDDYRDIIIRPENGCNKKRQEWINEVIGTKRSYTGSVSDLDAIQHAHAQETENSNSQEEVVDEMRDVVNGNADVQDMSTLSQIAEQWSNDFFSAYTQGSSFWEGIQQGIQNNAGLSSSIDFDLSLDPAIQKGYTDITTGLCQGFQVGKGCGGLPVPFNMSFLTPGDLQVMGCKVANDKGLPIFAFPTSSFPYVWPPNPSGAGGIFGGNTSQFRLYVSPTLTQQVGVATCFGPYSVGNAVPAPFNALGGNCIVTAISPDLSCENNVDIRPNGDDSLSQDWHDIAQAGSCSLPAVQAIKSMENPPVVTPFEGVDDVGGATSSVVQEGTFLAGMLHIDRDPVTLSSEDISTDSVSLIPGKDTKNIIKGGNGKGLAQCIVQGWLDPQITYIANNLTTMNITMYYPDIGSLTQGMGRLDAASDASAVDAIPKNATTTLANAVKSPRNEKLINTIGIQKATVESRDKPLNNPFTQLEKLLKQVPLINVSRRTVPITIPMLTDDDVTSYESSIHEWINHNKVTVQERKDSLSAVVGVCGHAANLDDIKNMTIEDFQQKKSLVLERLQTIKNNSTDSNAVDLAQSCTQMIVSGKLDTMVIFQNDLSLVMQGVQANLQSIRTYKEFPNQLQKLLHSVDRYIADTVAFVANFFGRINERLATNARIFNGYVDAIIAMKAAVNTWQAMIDLSVDWKKSCSSCSNDNYGSYSCNLSFLCPNNLPILQFPSLKIPDIYLDFSSIDAALDIVLPEISFVSQSVDLPTLPNLPKPPVFEVDLTLDSLINLNIEKQLSFMQKIPTLPSLPAIPTLPEAPTLPDLPPIVPQIDMSLPYLPPPPEIPELSSKIAQMITVGENIGKLYCVMKGDVGLVAESGVKAKIEQLTQRSWNVPIFDYFNLTSSFDSPTLQGMDFLVESKVDFTMNVDHIYAVLQGIADVSNSYVDKGFTQANIASQETVNDTNNTLQNASDKVKDPLLSGSVSRTDDIPQVNWADLLTTISTIQNKQTQSTPQLDSLVSMIRERQSSQYKAYYHDLTNQQNTILSSMEKYQSRITSAHNALVRGSMDDVLALTQHTSHIEAYEGRMVATLGVPSSLEKMKTINPGHDYLLQSKKILAGYKNDIDRFASTSLQASKRTYESLSQKIAQTTHATDAAIAKTTPSLPLHTQLASNNTSSSSSIGYDYSAYLQGTYVSSGGVSYDVLDVTYRENQIQGYKQTDVNNDGSDDVVRRDAHSIYLKYGHQKKTHEPFVDSEVEGEVRYIDLGSKKEHIKTDGTYRLNNEYTVRVGSTLPRVYDVKVAGQSFDSVIFSWNGGSSQGWNYSGYVMRLVQRVDIHQDHAHRDVRNPTMQDHYVLVIGQQDPVPAYIRLERDRSYEKTQDLIDQGKLSLKRVSLPSDTVTVGLVDLERERHYAQVAHVAASDKGAASVTIAGPWSTQVVAGPQILADDSPPSPSVTLLRERLNDAVVGSGLLLNGNVGTYYSLNVKWNDATGVKKNRIRRPDGATRTYTGGIASWTGLFFTGKNNYRITVGAEDFQDNVGEQLVSWDVDVPDIDVIGIKTGVNNGSIVARLSEDIDSGSIQFSHKGHAPGWSVLSGTNGVSFPVQTSQTIVTGGLYTMGDQISLYENDGTRIGLVDPHTGKISLLSPYDEIYDIVGQWKDYVLRWYVIQKDTHTSRFEITLPIETIHQKRSQHPLYERKDSSIDGIVSCLVYEDTCIVAENSNHQLFIPAPYNYLYRATYRYDDNTHRAHMVIIHQGDNIPVADIEMTLLDLLTSS